MKKSWKVLASFAAAAALVIAPVAANGAAASSGAVASAGGQYPTPTPTSSTPGSVEVTPWLTWTDPTCEIGGSISTSSEGVEWSAVLNEDGSTTYFASPAKGYSFPDGAQIEWTVPDLTQLSSDEECTQAPAPVFDQDSECTSPGWRTVTFTKTDWVWDADAGTWRLGDPVVVKTESFYDALCEEVVPEPAAFNADPTPPTCDKPGALPDVSGAFEHVTLSFDRPFDGPGSYTLTARTLDGFTFGDGKTELTRVLAVAAANPDDESCASTPDDPPLVPGDITSECVGSVPYLSYAVELPSGFVADSDTPLTVTFVHPTDPSQNYVVPDLSLAGTLLWPGASATAPLQWPGWELLPDGTYVETDGNFAWTRSGVTVLFEVNPSYQTVVTYPPESALCANPAAADPEAPLAATGGMDMRPWGIAALAVVMTGLSLFFTRRHLARH